MNIKKLFPAVSAHSVHVDGTSKFVARDHFKVARSGDGVVVQISHIGQGFNQYFINLVEEPVEPCEIVPYDLSDMVSDVDIQRELGQGYTLKLGHVWHLLKGQGHGESGPLITNTWPNVFHIQTDGRSILPVSAQWWGCGVWTINGGYPFETPKYLNVSRVFGRLARP